MLDLLLETPLVNLWITWFCIFSAIYYPLCFLKDEKFRASVYLLLVITLVIPTLIRTWA